MMHHTPPSPRAAHALVAGLSSLNPFPKRAMVAWPGVTWRLRGEMRQRTLRCVGGVSLWFCAALQTMFRHEISHGLADGSGQPRLPWVADVFPPPEALVSGHMP